MKYETPQMTALTSAINVIQSTSEKHMPGYVDTWDPGSVWPEKVQAYTDWE
jgi:hypothetical protein